MAGWKRRAVGDLPLYQATTLSWLPDVIQGFTTRRGGVSQHPYDSLNLGGRGGDSPDDVNTNLERLYTDLGLTADCLAMAEQVHGSGVGRVTESGTPPASGVDALITDVPGILLLMLYADCVPVYLFDPLRRAVGLIHSGWRGTAANITGKAVAAMQAAYGVDPRRCLAAVGPCIGGDSYEVGVEVADHFRNFIGGRSAGASTAVFPKDELAGKYLLNLRQIIYTQLLSAGLAADSIAVCDEDTYRNRRDFFSYRRDGEKSGRRAAYFGLRSSRS